MVRYGISMVPYPIWDYPQIIHIRPIVIKFQFRNDKYIILITVPVGTSTWYFQKEILHFLCKWIFHVMQYFSVKLYPYAAMRLATMAVSCTRRYSFLIFKKGICDNWGKTWCTGFSFLLHTGGQIENDTDKTKSPSFFFFMTVITTHSYFLINTLVCTYWHDNYLHSFNVYCFC